MPSDCEHLEFENVAKHTENTLFSTKFTLYEEEINIDSFGGAMKAKSGMPTYTNGREFLSYITKGSAPQGTWIVGDKPERDRGFIFTDVYHASRNPVGLLNWKWLSREQWEDDEDVRVTCTSAPRASHFYVVEVLEKSLSALSTSQRATGVISAHLFFDKASSSGWILVLDTGIEVSLDIVSVLAEVGETLRVPDTLSRSNKRGCC